jgi:hypothetical protein
VDEMLQSHAAHILSEGPCEGKPISVGRECQVRHVQANILQYVGTRQQYARREAQRPVNDDVNGAAAIKGNPCLSQLLLHQQHVYTLDKRSQTRGACKAFFAIQLLLICCLAIFAYPRVRPRDFLHYACLGHSKLLGVDKRYLAHACCDVTTHHFDATEATYRP